MHASSAVSGTRVRRKPAGTRKKPARSNRVRKKPSCSKKKGASQSQVATGPRARAAVFSGKKQITIGRLTKTELVKNRTGKVVSKKKSESAKKGNHFGSWSDAVKKARKALGITGFCPVGGDTDQGKAFYARAKLEHTRPAILAVEG